LAPLWKIPGIHWYSLQVGERRADLDAAPAGAIEDLSPSLGDFADTAAAMSQLDLVLTVDTAAAHLAGAIGRPTWVMLPFAPDWRWLMERRDSPWYRSVRLFRQNQRGAWGSVIRDVEASLSAEPPPSR
jgi:ADP-heptose:LPS heptosyltransferase